MSKSLIPLLKVNLTQIFSFAKSTKTTKAKKNIPFYAILSFVLIFGLFISTIYSFSFLMICEELQIDKINMVYAMTGFAAMLALLTTVMKVKTTLFAGNDYDLLASLPIRKSHIIAVKFLSLYLLELLFCFILIFPVSIIYIVSTKNYGFIDTMLYLIILTPVIPLLLSSIIGVFISFIADRFRFGNILSVVLLIGFMIVAFYFSYLMQSGSATEQNQSIMTMFEVLAWFNPSTILLKLNIHPGFTRLAYIGVNIGVLIVVLLGLAWCYDYIHILLTSSKSHREYVRKELKVQHQFKALLFFDIKRYVTSRTYMLNTLPSGIMCIVMVVILSSSFNSIPAESLGEIGQLLSSFYVVMILWCSGISTPSCCAINIEGKSMWMVKSLPINYKKYCYSKIILSELFIAPLVLVASIICQFMAKDLTIWSSLGIFILPQVYLFGINCLGLYVNIRTPKIHWTNEIEAVKNSKSAVIMMLIGFLYVIVIAALYIGVSFVSSILSFGLTLAFIGIVSITIFILTIKTASVKLQEIEV